MFYTFSLVIKIDFLTESIGQIISISIFLPYMHSTNIVL